MHQRILSCLTLLFFLSLPSLAQEVASKAPSGSVVLSMSVSVQFGDRKMAAAPVAAVTSGQEAELIIAEDELNKLTITVLPVVENSQGQTERLNLTVEVEAVSDGQTYNRRLQFTTIAGVENKFQDKQTGSEMSFKVKASIVP